MNWNCCISAVSSMTGVRFGVPSRYQLSPSSWMKKRAGIIGLTQDSSVRRFSFRFPNNTPVTVRSLGRTDWDERVEPIWFTPCVSEMLISLEERPSMPVIQKSLSSLKKTALFAVIYSKVSIYGSLHSSLSIAAMASVLISAGLSASWL